MGAQQAPNRVGQATGRSPVSTKKPKTSRAARAAIIAFRGISPTDEEVVLKELGLMVDPVARAAAEERERNERDGQIAATVSPWDMSEFLAVPGEQGFGLPPGPDDGGAEGALLPEEVEDRRHPPHDEDREAPSSRPHGVTMGLRVQASLVSATSRPSAMWAPSSHHRGEHAYDTGGADVRVR